MSRNYYSEINLHIVWHTKNSTPMLTPPIEAIVHQSIRSRCYNTAGVYFHEIGGIEDHTHVVLSIAPTILISEFIGRLKGGSSHDANQKCGHKVFDWQNGYGVVSFGTGDMPWVVDYVRKQRQHHAAGKAVDRLERMTAIDEIGAGAAQAEPREAP